MKCADCQLWLRGILRRYPKSEQFTPAVGEGEGLCRASGPLEGKPTPADFGCAKFVLGTADDQIRVLEVDAEPWQVWHMIPCPDCRGEGASGDASCHRCAGTGHVRHYDDGYIGEEQTREHPIEKQARLAKIRDEAMARAQAQIDEELQRAAEPPTPVAPEAPRPIL